MLTTDLHYAMGQLRRAHADLRGAENDGILDNIERAEAAIERCIEAAELEEAFGPPDEISDGDLAYLRASDRQDCTLAEG